MECSTLCSHYWTSTHALRLSHKDIYWVYLQYSDLHFGRPAVNTRYTPYLVYWVLGCILHTCIHRYTRYMDLQEPPKGVQKGTLFRWSKRGAIRGIGHVHIHVLRCAETLPYARARISSIGWNPPNRTPDGTPSGGRLASQSNTPPRRCAPRQLGCCLGV